ncbi:hypothetical protein FPQ18DRAFT_383562 [Pyronema domesticum]|nr:hypothetical protein FPQ18DRAFT_383562 [Pyronema domesticum]
MNPAFLFKLLLPPLTTARLLPDGSSRCLLNDMSHVQVYLGDTYNSNTLRLGGMIYHNHCADLITAPIMGLIMSRPPPTGNEVACDSFEGQLQPFPDSTWVKAYKIVPGTAQYGRFGDKPVCCFFYEKEGCKIGDLLFGGSEHRARGSVVSIPKGDVTRGEKDRTKIRSWKCFRNCGSPADALKAEIANA